MIGELEYTVLVKESVESEVRELVRWSYGLPRSESIVEMFGSVGTMMQGSVMQSDASTDRAKQETRHKDVSFHYSTMFQRICAYRIDGEGETQLHLVRATSTARNYGS